jgi:hypothetical protein
VTMARLLRSGVKRKFHAPFCSGGRGREAPPYRNLDDGVGVQGRTRIWRSVLSAFQVDLELRRR